MPWIRPRTVVGTLGGAAVSASSARRLRVS